MDLRKCHVVLRVRKMTLKNRIVARYVKIMDLVQKCDIKQFLVPGDRYFCGSKNTPDNA
jgi:hypothetical protein